MKSLQKINLIGAFVLMCCLFAVSSAQSYLTAQESARSDKITNSAIEKTTLVAGDADIEITINVPAFQLTLWQNGKEVKSYWIGVGLKDFPIYIGDRFASEVIWNPNWIVPDSEWVSERADVKPGEVIKPTDPRNPIGKLKIPLGDGYLIHQAKGTTDLGSLVSHGCVRMMKADLYDLAEKIVQARALPLTAKQIEAAKTSSKTVAAKLDPTVPVEITYDTIVVEAGKLHVYPDVYDLKTNSVENLRKELKTSGIDDSNITDATLGKIIARTIGKKQFVVGAESVEQDLALTNGRLVSVVGGATQPNTKTVIKKKSANGAGLRPRRVAL